MSRATETPPQQFERLLKALEILIGEETALVDAAENDPIAELQDRIQSVIDSLVACMPEKVADRTRAKLQTLIERRQQNIDALSARLSATKDELDALHQSVRRAARIVPAYGRAEGGAARSQLRATG